MKNCVFCNILKGEISKVYEDKHFVAFMDIQPVNAGHVLVIPKMHSKLISEMNAKDIGKLMVLGVKIGTAIRKSKIKSEGINFILADGAAAGQDIFHTHLHVIPRFKNDGFGYKFPKKHFKKPDRKELDKIAATIRSSFE